jgi:hypothetical protein
MKASVLLLFVLMAIGVTLPALAQARQPGVPASPSAIVLGAAEPEGTEGETAEEPQAAEEGQEGAEAQEGQEESEEEGGATAGSPQGKHRSHGERQRHSTGKQSRRKANVGGHGKHKPATRKHGKRKARTSTRGAKR